MTFVVVTRQVQDAVNQQKQDFFFCPDPRDAGMPDGGVRGYDHIAQERGPTLSGLSGLKRKGNDVGRSRAPEILSVQARNLGIVYDYDADFTIVTFQDA